MGLNCAVCGSVASIWRLVDGYVFTDCTSCGSIAITAEAIDFIDRGHSIRSYGDEYWQSEVSAGKERSWGSSIARAAEAIYLCQRKVEYFLDLGTGDGSFLDAISYYLPKMKDKFFGYEMFPPLLRTNHIGYFSNALASIERQFDSGICVEVIEHLTPNMLKSMLLDLYACSNENASFIFNTGLGDYVRFEDASYIDPRGRGHIVSYGWQAVANIFHSCGFSVHRLGNRNWAFLAEKNDTASFDIHKRIWHPRPENVAFLNDGTAGNVLQILARESLRAYLS